jgi:hypothetical protein
MRYQVAVGKRARTASLLLMMALATGSARAQNRTPANLGPPITWTDPSIGLMA